MKGEFIFSHFVWCNITCKVPEKAKQISNKDQSKCKAKVKQILSKGQAKAKQNLSKGWAKAKQRPSKGHFRLLRKIGNSVLDRTRKVHEQIWGTFWYFLGNGSSVLP